MTDLRVTTMRRMDAVLEEACVADFKKSLRGQLIAPGDKSYEEARQVWNANIDRRPGLICGPAGVADVISAVTFAGEHTLLVAVRGGGHNVAGNAVCAGGLMIDLSRMKGMHVDPVHRTARAEPGRRPQKIKVAGSGVAGVQESWCGRATSSRQRTGDGPQRMEAGQVSHRQR